MIRFRILFAQAEARAAANGGIAVPPAPPKTRLTDRPKPAQKPDTARVRLPWRFAWLLQYAQETGAFGSQVHHLITRPEIQPLIASDPRFGRILRPLFHTLGMDLPAYLQLPKRKRLYKPRPPKPRKPREKGWSLDYEKSKDGRTHAPETLPPWYFPKASAPAPVPQPAPHPPPTEPIPYAVLIKRFIGHGQR